jgi:metal-responsive CopG/Arc/MetJ family transcriptional regulator
MPRRSLRVPETLDRTVSEVARQRGYRSWSAFVVEAMQEKSRRLEATDSMSETEARIAANFNQIMSEVRSLHTSMQAQFALTDALTKYVLTCMVEPPADVLSGARAKAKARYEKLIRAAAKTVTGQIDNSLYEAVTNGD